MRRAERAAMAAAAACLGWSIRLTGPRGTLGCVTWVILQRTQLSLLPDARVRGAFIIAAWPVRASAEGSSEHRCEKLGGASIYFRVWGGPSGGLSEAWMCFGTCWAFETARGRERETGCKMVEDVSRTGRRGSEWLWMERRRPNLIMSRRENGKLLSECCLYTFFFMIIVQLSWKARWMNCYLSKVSFLLFHFMRSAFIIFLYGHSDINSTLLKRAILFLEIIFMQFLISFLYSCFTLSAYEKFIKVWPD